MTIVIDASVLVDFYLGSEAVDAIASRVRGEVLQAPVTVDAEIVHSLRRQTLAGRIDVALAEHALRRFIATRIVRHPVEPLVARMWSLRRNITAYDASYVALAESLSLPLVTATAVWPNRAATPPASSTSLRIAAPWPRRTTPARS